MNVIPPYALRQRTQPAHSNRVAWVDPEGKSCRNIHFISQSGGFTLIEVILAISIAIGMLGIVLYYYQQAADLRNTVMVETSRVTSIRLIMDRLTSELRTALPATGLHSGMNGSSNELEFVRLDVPIVSPLTMDTNLPASSSPVTLKKVHYLLSASKSDSNSTSFVRIEVPAICSTPVTNASTSSGTSVIDTNTIIDTNLTVSLSQDANEAVTLEETNLVSGISGGMVVAKELNYLQFRYWNGYSWSDSWSEEYLPLGIEINLGIEPLLETDLAEGYAGELYQRIIYLPTGSRGTDTNSASSDLMGSGGGEL